MRLRSDWVPWFPGTGVDEAQSATTQTLKQAQVVTSTAATPVATWEEHEGGGVSITHRQPVSYLTWHAKGDYFASVAPTGMQAILHCPCLASYCAALPAARYGDYTMVAHMVEDSGVKALCIGLDTCRTWLCLQRRAYMYRVCFCWET